MTGAKKESLNSDGHQFRQYQQSEQPPLILTDLTEQIKTTAYDVWNPCPHLGQVHKSGGDNQLMGYPPSPLVYSELPIVIDF